MIKYNNYILRKMEKKQKVQKLKVIHSIISMKQEGKT